MLNLEKGIKKRRLTPVQILALGFFIVIIIGTILLMLPISSKANVVTPFIDAFFTSTSAVCITGLATLNTADHWSYFGTTILILLVQIGGLGFMSFATLFALILGKKITLKDRLIMQEAMNTFSLQGLVKLAKYILIFTFVVEGIGALFLSTKFIPDYGIARGTYLSIFYSISAFCNAGFDLTGNSLVPYASDAVIILTISALIVIGGLGFTVWAELYNFKGIKKLSVHSKLVLTMTIFLIVFGWISIYIFEITNPETLKNMSIKGQMLSSFFVSVCTRSGGFSSISLADMTLAGTFLTMIFMFIGGAPGGTAGGIKITTIGILIMTVVSVFRNDEDTKLYNRTVSKELVYKSFVIFTIAMALVIAETMVLSFTEMGASLEYILFEVISAFATVGLSLGLTPELSIIGKLLISATMFIGRVGTLTLFLALSNRKNGSAIKYPEAKILVG